MKRASPPVPLRTLPVPDVVVSPARINFQKQKRRPLSCWTVPDYVTSTPIVAKKALFSTSLVWTCRESMFALFFKFRFVCQHLTDWKKNFQVLSSMLAAILGYIFARLIAMQGFCKPTLDSDDEFPVCPGGFSHEKIPRCFWGSRTKKGQLWFLWLTWLFFFFNFCTTLCTKS